MASRYQWSLFEGKKVGEIHKKPETGERKYKKLADLFIKKVSKKEEITNPSLKKVRERDDLERIISSSKLSKKKKKELLDALDVRVGAGVDGSEIIIEGKKLSFPSSNYYIKPVKIEYDPDKPRECVYISGGSGTGKSQWISSYLDSYREKFPDNDIVLFSAVEQDECLDRHKPIRINMDDLVDDPITDLKELADTCCIFDDTAAIPDKKVNLAVRKIRDMICEKGRHDNVTCLVTSHIPMEGQVTKYPIREGHRVVVFPEGNETPMANLLREYCGFGKKNENADLVNLIVSRENSRWADICKRIPKYVLFKRSALIL